MAELIESVDARIQQNDETSSAILWKRTNRAFVERWGCKERCWTLSTYQLVCKDEPCVCDEDWILYMDTRVLVETVDGNRVVLEEKYVLSYEMEIQHSACGLVTPQW